jgi:hypothetical protein
MHKRKYLRWVALPIATICCLLLRGWCLLLRRAICCITSISTIASLQSTPNQNELNSFQDRMEIIIKTNKRIQRAHRKN